MYTDAGPMWPICRVQIERRRRLDRAQWTVRTFGRLIIPRSNLIMLCELNQDDPMAENAQ